MRVSQKRSLFVFLTFCLVWLSVVASAQIYDVRNMTTDQLAALDREKTAVILPGGILEQHGPHLPSFTDGFINQRLTQDLAAAIARRPGWNALVFPLIPLGTGGANELGRKYNFPGTYAVRFTTLRAIFMDLATELGEQGFRWIFVVHAHGAPNHNRALDQAGEYFHDTYDGDMVHLTGTFSAEQPVPTSVADAEEDGVSIHAGMDETSVLLYLQPDLVQPNYRELEPRTGRNLGQLVEIAESDDWTGYFGSPRLATAERGEKLYESLATSIINLANGILDGEDYQGLPRMANVTSLLPAQRGVNESALAHDREIARQQQEWLESKGLD